MSADCTGKEKAETKEALWQLLMALPTGVFEICFLLKFETNAII